MIPPAAIPLAATTLRAWAGIAAAGALVGALAWTHWHVYGLGRRAAEAEGLQAQLAAEQARAKALEGLAAANAQMLQIQADADMRVAEAQRAARVRVQTIEKVIHANPDFAAVSRPDDLQRLRDESLAAIAAAADRSAGLSAAGARSVRGAGDAEGSDAGGK